MYIIIRFWLAANESWRHEGKHCLAILIIIVKTPRRTFIKFGFGVTLEPYRRDC